MGSTRMNFEAGASMKATISFVLIGTVTLIASFFVWYWIDTQPLWTTSDNLPEHDLLRLPATNQNVIRYVEARGDVIAPSYEETVCTEFVIDVIENFHDLSRAERNEISIITDQNLNDLIGLSSPVITGVQAALIKAGKGERIENPIEVKPGDFVQFWNLYNGKAYGHCGIVMSVNAGKTLTLYSSHPVTDGYGKQTWLWPEHVYFVRMRQ